MITVTGLRKSWLATIFIVAMTACASRGGNTATKSSDASLLGSEEITKSGFTDVYSAVQVLRPQWMRGRGAVSLNNRSRETVKVYLDDNLYGTVEALRQIQANSVASIRHMDAMEASNRYGLDHGAGAILVYSRK